MPLPAPPRHLQLALPGSLAVLVALFATFGDLKPPTAWQWLDLAGEGGTALMAGVWAWVVLGSRPGGRVTAWLAAGLAGIMLGAGADTLDELYRLEGAARGLGWIESVAAPLGMLALTVGLLLWRQEQAALNEHMSRRERLFRDHRAFDRVTQLANADYLRRQIVAERAQRPGEPCAVALVDLVDFDTLAREHGPAEAQRGLQAVAHQLLLNLQHDGLLCRYAGHRFVVLLPGADLVLAQRRAAHLCRMVDAMQFHPRSGGAPLALRARVACATAEPDVDGLLDALNRAVAGEPPGTPAAAH